MAEPTIYIVDRRHYDVVWRKTLEEYGDLQERHLLKAVNLMRDYPQYMLTIEQAIIVSNFLARHFELEQEIGIRIRERKICIAGGFYAIPDTNMVSGEALFRNLLYGTRYFKERFSHDITTASLYGPSGWSAQMPQMFNILGIKQAAARQMPGLRLESPDGSISDKAKAFQWEGLDGSTIPVYMPTIEFGPTCFYPEPFQETFRTRESSELLDIYKGILKEAQEHEDPLVWIDIWDEERKIDEELIDAIWEERRKKSSKQMIFAEVEDFVKAAKPALDAIHRGEINPLHTGTFSTRISLKQASVMLENLIIDTEKWFAAAVVERLHFPELKFHDLWEQIFILQSHHGISGCNTDKVKHRLDSLVTYTRRELDGLKTRALSAICSQINAPKKGDWRPLHVFNSLNWDRRGIVTVQMTGGAQIADDAGNPVPVLNSGGNCMFLAEVPACGYNTYWFLPGGGLSPQEVELDKFETGSLKVDIHEDGSIGMTDKKNNVVITGDGTIWGGIIVREDRGSLWCKGYTGKEAASKVDSRKLYRALLGWELERTGSIKSAEWPEFGSLKWKQLLFFYDDLPFFDMLLDINWQGSATELRLMLPFGSFAMGAVYGIPFGASARLPYDADSCVAEGKSLVQGEEWPTCRWVEFGDGDYGITVAHTGTPGIKCDRAMMEISLLRSPVHDPEYSHEFYMKPERGSHDNGRHSYRFRFMPSAGDWRSAGSYRVGYELQNLLFAYAGPGHEGRSALKRSMLDFGPKNLICTGWTSNRLGHHRVQILEAEGTATELVWGRKPDRSIYFATPDGERLEAAEKIFFKPFELKHILLR